MAVKRAALLFLVLLMVLVSPTTSCTKGSSTNQERNVTEETTVTTTPTAVSTTVVAVNPGATYTGTTSEGKLFEFIVSDDGSQITQLAVEWADHCPPEAILRPERFGWIFLPGVVPIINDSFSSSESDGTTFTGHFTSAGKVEGEIIIRTEVPSQEFGHVPCEFGPITWTAAVR